MTHTTLPSRMRQAAATLREANALYGYQPDYGVWNPLQLDKEADVVESEVPS